MATGGQVHHGSRYQFPLSPQSTDSGYGTGPEFMTYPWSQGGGHMPGIPIPIHEPVPGMSPMMMPSTFQISPSPSPTPGQAHQMPFTASPMPAMNGQNQGFGFSAGPGQYNPNPGFGFGPRQYDRNQGVVGFGPNPGTGYQDQGCYQDLSNVNWYPPTLDPSRVIIPPGFSWLPLPLRQNLQSPAPAFISCFGVTHPFPMYPNGLPGVTNPPGSMQFVRKFLPPLPDPVPMTQDQSGSAVSESGDLPPTPPRSPPESPIRVNQPYSNVVHVPNPNGLGITESHYYPYDLAIIEESLRLLGVKPVYDPNIARSHEERSSNSTQPQAGGFTEADAAQLSAWQEFKQNGRETELFSDDEREETILNEDGVPISALRTKRPRKNRNNYVPCCVFCRSNGETADLYTSHEVHDKHGKTTCPVLRKYVCPICGATGDNGHTIRYCNKNNDGSFVPHAHVITGRNAAGFTSKIKYEVKKQMKLERKKGYYKMM